MKNWIFIGFLFLSAILITSCGLDDEPRDCITGPVGFNVEFIDTSTGENVYMTGRFQSSQFRITDEDNNLVNHRFITELDKTYIQVTLPFETGDKIITMKLDDNTDVDFELTLSSVQESCITYFISAFEVPEYGYEESETLGVVRVSL